MAELKTKKTADSVKVFLANAGRTRQEDCQVISKMMEEATRSKPTMWGTSIVGFGDYLYTYPDGRTMDWFTMGFSPRKQALTLYVHGATSSELLKKLGKHKTGKGCLYIKSLTDVDLAILKKIIDEGAKRKNN